MTVRTAGRCFVPLLLAGLASAAAAQAPQAKKEVIQTAVTTADGWTIPLTYYRTADDREAAVVVLVQGEGANRQVWTSLARRLHAAGYAVVTLDPRKSGEASYAGGGRMPDRTTPTDYRMRVAGDLEAVKEFLHEEHQAGRLNIRKTGLAAAAEGAPLAIAFAVNDWMRPPLNDAITFAQRTPRGQDVRAVALLAPEAGVPGVTVGNAVRKLATDPNSRVSFWVGVGDRDRSAARTAEALYQQTGGGDQAEVTPGTQTHIFRSYAGVAQHGTDLLQPQVDQRWQVTEGLVAFFDATLKSLPGGWVDRAGRR